MIIIEPSETFTFASLLLLHHELLIVNVVEKGSVIAQQCIAFLPVPYKVIKGKRRRRKRRRRKKTKPIDSTKVMTFEFFSL